MKIIDAHLHIFPSEPRTDAMAEKVGHVNSVEHLREVCGQLEIVHGVVMGNRSLDVGFHNYPTDLFHYCVGLDSLVLDRGETIPKDLPDQVEEHLKRENCCGVKLYPGYNKIWLTDPIYQPYQDAGDIDGPRINFTIRYSDGTEAEYTSKGLSEDALWAIFSPTLPG